MKTTVKVEQCSMYVEGMDLKCPLCQTLVKSGERHECTTEEKPKRVAIKPNQRRKKAGIDSSPAKEGGE